MPAAMEPIIKQQVIAQYLYGDEAANKVIHDLRIGDLILGSDAAIIEQKAEIIIPTFPY